MTQPIHIIPQPVSLKTGDGVFQLSDSTPIISGDGCDKVAQLAAELLNLDLDADPSTPGLSLTLEAGSTPAEGYELSVTPEQIAITASDERGLAYGIQTLRQLMPADQIANRTEAADIPAVTIEDHPKFEWRAQHLDVCRHFFSVAFVKRYIDLLAFHKMNIFHWHLTEDQGWRIAIDKYPKLTEISSQRAETPLPENRHVMDGIPYGGIYSKEDIKEVVEYAASRFITVMPEIELPGHTIAVLAAYPELGCTGKDYKVRTEWGIEDDVFCAGNDEVFTFLEDVFDEVLELFPSEYIHIGGDECPKVRWAECPKCQARKKAEGLENEEELQSWFISKIGHYLHSKGRKMIGWDEILEGGLPPGAAVMSWRGTEGGIEAASLGNRVVMSPNTHCYFDYYQTSDYENEPPAFYWPIPEEHQVPGGPTFHGLVTLERCYSFDPHEGVPASFHNMVMGGQSNTWTEYIPTNEQVEYQQYPRGCALAETLWSPMPKGGRDFAEFIGRLTTHLQRLDTLGVNYRHPKEQLPQIKSLESQPYAGIRVTAAMPDLSTVIPQCHDEVLAWLEKLGSNPVGPSFVRYYDVSDMEGGLDIEMGWPVENGLSGDDRVSVGQLPAGQYATKLFIGEYKGLMQATADLFAWGEKQSIEWAREGELWESRFENYIIDPGDEPNPNKWQTEIAIKIVSAE